MTKWKSLWIHEELQPNLERVLTWMWDQLRAGFFIDSFDVQAAPKVSECE